MERHIEGLGRSRVGGYRVHESQDGRTRTVSRRPCREYNIHREDLRSSHGNGEGTSIGGIDTHPRQELFESRPAAYQEDQALQTDGTARRKLYPRRQRSYLNSRQSTKTGIHQNINSGRSESNDNTDEIERYVKIEIRVPQFVRQDNKWDGQRRQTRRSEYSGAACDYARKAGWAVGSQDEEDVRSHMATQMEKEHEYQPSMHDARAEIESRQADSHGYRAENTPSSSDYKVHSRTRGGFEAPTARSQQYQHQHQHQTQPPTSQQHRFHEAGIHRPAGPHRHNHPDRNLSSLLPPYSEPRTSQHHQYPHHVAQDIDHLPCTTEEHVPHQPPPSYSPLDHQQQPSRKRKSRIRAAKYVKVLGWFAGT